MNYRAYLVIVMISAIFTYWHVCNDPGFGVGSGGDYGSEEGFEVEVWGGKMYVGMEGDNSIGAMLWRSKEGITMPISNTHFEEVIGDNGIPFGSLGITSTYALDHVDSVKGYGGYLYVSTASQGTLQSNAAGTRIFRSSSGADGSWEQVVPAGFGLVGSNKVINFKDMQEYQGQLCGGTYDDGYGSEVMCTGNGTTWVQKNISGFGAIYYNNRSVKTWSGHVYGGRLYFGIQNLGAYRTVPEDDVAMLYYTSAITPTTPTWTQAYVGGAGSIRVDILGDIGGSMYIATKTPVSGTMILKSESGTGSWVQTGGYGLGDANNTGTVVDGAVVKGDWLYVALSNSVSGVQIWRTNGSIWQLVDKGLGDKGNVHAQLFLFNDELYAWVTNYEVGQKVIRIGF